MKTQLRRIVTVALIGGVCAILSIGLFSFYLESIKQRITGDLKQVQDATQKMLDTHVEQQFLDLQRMASRWAHRGSMDYETWLADARNYVKDMPGIHAIEWVDTDFYVRWIEPLKGNESVLNMLSAFDQRRMDALKKARDNNEPVFTKTINLVQGGKGFLLYVPINSGKKFHGFILGVYKVYDLVSDILEHYGQQYRFELYEDGQQIYERGPTAAAYEPVEGVIHVGESRWVLKVYPSNQVVDAADSFVPYVILIGGLCLSILIAILIHILSKTSSMNVDLARLQDDLRRSNRALDVFASTASHDLKAPLRHMTTYADFIEEDLGEGLSADVAEHIVGLRRSAKRMHELVEGILQYSRVDGQTQSNDECDLNNICRDVLQDLGQSIDEADAHIESNPLPIIFGDNNQWRQVFQNLINNSIIYRREDEPLKITIGCFVNGNTYNLFVKDNGRGFNQEDAGVVFQPFKRLVPQHEGSGTGIGLSTVLKIIQCHDGQIEVTAEMNQGACFTITLPASRIIYFAKADS